MEVKAISNSQPSFNGYLGRNIQTYVNHIVEKEVNCLVREANNRVKKVDENKIKEIKSLGDNVLGKFSAYVGNMNKKTNLDLNDVDSSYMRFIFKNQIASGKEVSVYRSIVHKQPNIFQGNVVIPESKDLSKIEDASKKDLHKLDIIADKLSEVNNREIDNIFFETATTRLKQDGESATGFWRKFKVRKLAKALDKFAQELGIDTSAQVRAEEYFKTAKERKISGRQFLKEMQECSKRNQKIAEDILKG